MRVATGIFVLMCLTGFVAYNLCKNIISPYIDNRYIKIIVYVIVFLLSNSVILFLIFPKTSGIHMNIDYIFYLSTFLTGYLLFYFFFTFPLRFFSFKDNLFLIDKIALLVGVILGIYGMINVYFVRLTEYNLKTDKNIKLKVAFMSDLHIGSMGITKGILTDAIEKINGKDVDLVILGGDIIEKVPTTFIEENYEDLFKRLKSKYGVFYILGNHEYYGSNSNQIVKEINNTNSIKILLDEKFETDDFILIGREDIAKTHHSSQGRKTIENINDDSDRTNKYIIVADHNPKYFDEAVKNNVDLQLSGHTHNGQFFPWNIAIKFLYEKAYGLLTKQNSNLIVSSGLSVWRIPIKLFSKPEVVVVNIN